MPRRRAARGAAEDPRGGPQPYVSAEKHALLDLHFGAPDERAGSGAQHSAPGVRNSLCLREIW